MIHVLAVTAATTGAFLERGVKVLSHFVDSCRIELSAGATAPAAAIHPDFPCGAVIAPHVFHGESIAP
jgi:hypothetical protein